MSSLLFLIFAFPLLGSLTLGLVGRRVRPQAVAAIGIFAVGLSFLATLGIGLPALLHPTGVMHQTLWVWMRVGGFHPTIGLRLDSLSWLMCLVVSFVSFLIHLYSAEYMEGDEGYSRFYSYMNLFVASMLILVLSDNLLLLYLGWEGVGLCSYLLIGFWYKDEANGLAARKAFVVTRVGDTAMAIGLFVLFWKFGTLDIQSILARAPDVAAGSLVLPAALLLGGAVGKSAQLPLQTWLPDAMAGPTPVSALIHAATMVTAGVYLIARTHTIFSLAPSVQFAVAVIGAATLLLAGFSALTQRDIKRILAYSTISQIGYMFLALGVGAWSAALFHFMTHAFFKALLFLCAGSVILALEEEHDIFKMGGLRKRLPWVFWAFLIGSCSLSALPIITAGFYSKDLILSQTYSSHAGIGLWIAGIVGAFLTSLYTFRMFFLVFLAKPIGGEPVREITRKPGWRSLVPISILAFLSIVGGWIGIPDFLGSVLPAGPAVLRNSFPAIVPGWVALLGIITAYVIYLKIPYESYGSVGRYWFSGWGFDWLYDRLFVRPYCRIAFSNRDDFVDSFFDGMEWISRKVYRVLSWTQSGQVRWYATALVGGALFLVILTERL